MCYFVLLVTHLVFSSYVRQQVCDSLCTVRIIDHVSISKHLVESLEPRHDVERFVTWRLTGSTMVLTKNTQRHKGPAQQ